jgi:glycosyltransferase 2 family protein
MTRSTTRPTKNQPSHPVLGQTQWVILFFIAGMILLGLAFLLFSDGPKLLDVIHQLNILSLVFAFCCMGGAYLALGFSFSSIFKMARHPVPFGRLFVITFISATFNYIISSGGMSTMAVRSFLLRHEKVPYSLSIPLSFAQNMIFNLVLSFVCLGGVIYLRNHQELIGPSKQIFVLIFMIGLITVVVLMVLVFFNRRFRHWFLRYLLQVISWVKLRFFRKKSSAKDLKVMQDEIEVSIKYLHRGWVNLLVVLFWVSMDWFCTALTLFFCFRAAGVHLSFGLLLVGFAVEFLTSTANVVPAGLGVTEGSMAGVFRLLGVDSNQALVAALLFRVIFFLIPLAIATVMYLDTMRTLWKSQVEHKKPQDPAFPSYPA